MFRSCALSFLLVLGTRGQSFEVASVKPAAPNPQRQAGTSPVHFNIDPQRVDTASFPLQNLIAFAYDVRWDEGEGPGWLKDVKVNVQAKPPEGTTREQIPAMLQTLLIERFGLAIHRENRRRNIYALIVGKDGLKTKELPPDTPTYMRPVSLPNNMIRMDFTDTFSMLATYLSPYVEIDRPVIDLTGTTGIYHVELDTPRGEIAANPNVISTSFPSAVEPFGLKLERRTIAVDFVVVDRINRTPVEN